MGGRPSALAEEIPAVPMADLRELAGRAPVHARAVRTGDRLLAGKPPIGETGYAGVREQNPPLDSPPGPVKLQSSPVFHTDLQGEDWPEPLTGTWYANPGNVPR